MKVTGQVPALVFGLTLLAALGWGGYRVVAFIAGLFTSLDFQVARITAIASVVALLAAVIIARAVRRGAGRGNSIQLLEGRAATYGRLIDLWHCLLRDECGTEDSSRTPSSHELRSVEWSLGLYGGTRVVKAYVTLRGLQRERGSQGPQVRSQLAKVLWEIRKDLGSDTIGLTAEDLQQLLFANAVAVSAPAIASDCQGRRLPVSLRSDS